MEWHPNICQRLCNHTRPRETHVVVVYQCSISNVMVSLEILKHFCTARFTLCQNVKTHPLLNGTYPILTSPWPGLWQVHTHYGFPHINTSLQVGRRMESVLGVWSSSRFERSISGWARLACVTTMLHSPVNNNTAVLCIYSNAFGACKIVLLRICLGPSLYDHYFSRSIKTIFWPMQSFKNWTS